MFALVEQDCLHWENKTVCIGRAKLFALGEQDCFN